MRLSRTKFALGAGLGMWLALAGALADEPAFDDQPLTEEVVHPPWFLLSFLDLPADLKQAVASGKRGLVVYFGQKYCPYCKALMDDLGKSDIATYTRTHFDVVALDIQGQRPVVDLQGRELTERALAERERTNFTPSLIFYDAEGREALRLRGYHPPYEFRAALEYVADGHHRRESFREYLERGGLVMAAAAGGLTQEDFFLPPPHALDRSRRPGERPLLVLFEQRECHACDVLHEGPLQNRVILGQLEMFDVVQLDLWAETPVITPQGGRTTSRRWAENLGLFYTPTLIFFDRKGAEILRLDSVAHFYRLRGVLDYILSGASDRGLSMQQWRLGPQPGARRGH